MKVKKMAGGSQQKTKKTPRRNRKKQKNNRKLAPNSKYEMFVRNLSTYSPASPSPNQIRRNPQIRKYVRQLKAQEEQQLREQQNSSSNRSYEEELDDYTSKRLSMEQPSTSAAVLPTQSPIKSPNSVISIPDDDSEIEEGEIVESEVTRCVDLIEESFNVLNDARKIIDLSPMKQVPLFFEDKRDTKVKEPPPPLYNPLNSSDDVIELDSTTTPDDSVIFVSEVKQTPKPLQKPQVLLSPAINHLMKLSGVRITPPTSAKKKPLSPNKIKRLERSRNYHKNKILNKKKNQIKYAQKEVSEAMGNAKNVQQSSTNTDPQPSTSTATSEMPSTSASVGVTTNCVKTKRKILIDGSNVAITHAKCTQGREYDKQSPNAFSVEGLNVAIKYFQEKGFQVKAVVPEYRLKNNKSSNPKLFHELNDDGFLMLTSSKAYDDRILLESASRLNAAVVSNDFFRDFKSTSNFLDVINQRLIRYNWAFDEFVLTEDSYGRNGPLLDDILHT